MPVDQNDNYIITRQDSSSSRPTARFTVIEARSGPHGGLTLKLRFDSGKLPKIRKLLNTTLTAIDPKLQEPFELEVAGFPVFGGKPSIDRLYRTGRIDLNVNCSQEESKQIRSGWQILIDLK